MASRIVRPHTAFPLSSGPKKRPRETAAGHLNFIRSLPCCVCGAEAESAHIRMGAMMYGKRETGGGEKASDKYTVPLCPNHHRNGPSAQHNFHGGEERFWRAVGIEPIILSALLWQVSGDRDAGHLIVEHARNLALWSGGVVR